MNLDLKGGNLALRNLQRNLHLVLEKIEPRIENIN